MDINQVKEKLQGPEYSFLRDNPVLKENIILLTTGGNIAYGTDVETSDIDIRGIALNTRHELLTMQCRDKPYENKETDTVIYTLQQIRKLLANANPNVLEILGTRENYLFVLKAPGKLLRENTELFLGFPFWLSIGNMIRLAVISKRTAYCYTDKRVILTSGFMGRDFKAIDYDKISNIEVNVGLLENMCKRGSIIIHGGGTHYKNSRTIYPKFKAIENPYEVFKNLKQVLTDVKIDWKYPNAYRPDNNPGYKTRYKR